MLPNQSTANPAITLVPDVYKTIFKLLTINDLLNVRLVSNHFYGLTNSFFWNQVIAKQFYITYPEQEVCSKNTYIMHAKMLENEKQLLTSAMFSQIIANAGEKLLNQVARKSRSNPNRQLTNNEEAFFSNCKEFQRNPSQLSLQPLLNHLQYTEKARLEKFKGYYQILTKLLTLPNDSLNQETIYLLSLIATKKILAISLKERFNKVFGAELCHSNTEYKTFAENVLQTLANAFYYNCEQIVTRLLRQHPQLPETLFTNYYGGSLLLVAIAGLHVSIMQILLANQAQPNQANTYYISSDPLLSDADLNFPTRLTNPITTPFYALLSKYDKLTTVTDAKKWQAGIELLLSYGADPDQASCTEDSEDVNQIPRQLCDSILATAKQTINTAMPEATQILAIIETTLALVKSHQSNTLVGNNR